MGACSCAGCLRAYVSWTLTASINAVQFRTAHGHSLGRAARFIVPACPFRAVVGIRAHPAVSPTRLRADTGGNANEQRETG